ncbi:demethylmenaquinone methyltransferase [Sediminivirga luteola]|uniref:Demethylmenaquinone methyltransferase n=1 Tax=Sediminivirga luteola TaxID=1774748 RepID=A0A8J2TX40_9MICO|nr:demethylmenaquinone methyltransferase [Sediminivirga luteola]MCI2265434.1 demethylmenaquinone methyltransferase [Sediminivirga luteola]GGA11212.1 demethylmenaquinone methyltransferase [Sediminivirga luteola]
MNRAQLDKKPREVAAMFDEVARRYDLTNEILSAGQATRWRKAVTRAVDPQPGQRILDLAAGTGTSSVPFLRAGAEVVAGDISSGMLEEGKRRHPEIDFRYADACDLPFADDSFDSVTISFGLRNIADTATALREMARVTKPGGRLVIAEFSTPVNPVVRTAYMEYLMKALPRVARLIASNPEAYIYLAESIRAWPDQQELSHRILDAGWYSVSHRNLNGGIVALHRAFL